MIGAVDPRVASAARNNAEWCEAVTRHWGGRSRFEAEFWINPGEAPIFYPNAVTLMPMEWVPTAIAVAEDGFAVKDSFASMDLAPLDYVPLFEATWIWRDPEPAPRSGDATWRIVRDAASLSRWADAWQEGTQATPFRPALLEEPNHAFIAGEVAGRIVAGCVASRSAAVVGISNQFGPDDLAAGCLTAVQGFAPSLPVVGYEQRPALALMKSLGFQELGPLRVWLKEAG